MFLRYNLYTIVWLVGMFTFLFLGREDVPHHQIFPFLSFVTLTHFIQFFVLTFFLIVGFTKQQQFVYLKFHAMKASLVVGVSYAILLEALYFFLPHLRFEIGNLITDIVGVGCGFAFFWIIYKL